MSINAPAQDMTSATYPIHRSTSQEALRQSIDSVEKQRLTGNMASNTNMDMASNTSMVSVAVDPVALITTECITVTSAMRKHARWAHSSVSSILGGSSSPLSSGFQNSRPATPRDDIGPRRMPKGYVGPEGNDDTGLANRWGLRGKKGKSMQDNPLMAGFGRLRRELTGCTGRRHKLFFAEHD